MKITDSPFWRWWPKMWTTSGGLIERVRYETDPSHSTLCWRPADGGAEPKCEYLKDFKEQPFIGDSATMGVIEFEVLEPLGLSLRFHDILGVYLIYQDCTGRTPTLAPGKSFPTDSAWRKDAIKAVFDTLQGAKKAP